MTYHERTPLRIPNLLHTALLLVFTLLAFLAAEVGALFIAHPHNLLAGVNDQRLQLSASAATYVLALVLAWFTFPLLWQRSFLDGLRWNARSARPLLIVAGIALGFTAQAVQSLLPVPKDLPIEVYFKNSNAIWFLALFATLVAPLFEEIVFRGFLLPALATAIDWLRLPRPSLDGASLSRTSAEQASVAEDAVARLDAWRASTSYSAPALVIASLLTSLAFALIHAPQLGYTWPVVSLLAVVSLVLCFVRLRTDSVAASTLVHASYNFSVFITLFIATSGFRHLDKL